MEKDKILGLRKRIDQIDKKILQLLNERFEIALKLRRLKEQITVPEREKEILQNAQRYPSYLMDKEFIEKIMTLIIERSKYIQAQEFKLIGFQGEHGAFSEIAALKFSDKSIPVPCKEFEDVFEETEKGMLDFGIVPIENSLEGGISRVYELLLSRDLYIVGEVNLPIHHCLLSLPDEDYRDLKVVYSHPQALNQCKDFIVRHKLEARPYYDTAGAAKMLSEKRMKGVCVIASKLCASMYGLDIIKENVEDHPDNVTRFLVLSKSKCEKGDKCSMIFGTKHEPGALLKVLKIFADCGINLTKIESKPKRGDPGSYLFYIDFHGSEDDKNTLLALDRIKKEAEFVKFLGFYPSDKRD